MGYSLNKQFGTVPVTAGILKSALREYKAPLARIGLLQKKGELISLRRNLYLCVPEEGLGGVSRGLIANHLVHPSYVSYETVLSEEGIIPERVFTVKSAVMIRSRNFENATGRYEFIQVPEQYFPIGVKPYRTEDGYYYLRAVPEKALCDLIVSSARVRVQSVKSMLGYLEEFLRADMDMIAAMNPELIRLCAGAANKKKNELHFLERVISHELV